MTTFGIHNQCVYIAVWASVILLCAFGMSGRGTSTSVTKYVCCACEARNAPAFFNSKTNARIHVTKSARCKGSSVKKVSIMTRPGDVIAGGAGGMGQCPAPQHQPPGEINIPDICYEYEYNIPDIFLCVCHIPYISLKYV